MTSRLATATVVAGVFSGGLVAVLATAAAQGPDAVIELFTSQGCASCPPADALFAEYAARDDILALSFNVDYWDYLGWKDTLASPLHTERQRAYAIARGDGAVYTPQAIVDGITHAVGSDRSQIEAALSATIGELTVPIALTQSADAITVEVGAAPDVDMPHATVWLVMYQPAVTVVVERGENTGRILTYSNVVRKLRPVAMWKGQSLSIDLPKSEMAKTDADRCAVLLQLEDRSGRPGAILGAATISWDD